METAGSYKSPAVIIKFIASAGEHSHTLEKDVD